MPPSAGPIILTSTDGRPWTPDGFRASWGKACKKAGITGVTFNDLRGTAVTRLALVGCTEAQIATITGHSLRDVRSILDAHYLHRDIELARSAITKLEMGYAKSGIADENETCRFVANSSKWASKWSTESNEENGKSSMGSTGWGTRIRT